MQYRLQRLEIMGPWYGRALAVAASSIPIGVFTWLLQEFAGQDTNLDVNIVASASVVANLAMGGAVYKTRAAMREQSEELNRLRGERDALERAASPMLGSTKKRGTRP